MRSERVARAAVLELLQGVGPGVGLAVLAGQFPDLPRAELAVQRYEFLIWDALFRTLPPRWTRRWP
ncbi:MAG TPA: hypothetical protein VKD72_24580 [Gemmataceae bacterium]|nr:hypothetical protein [Gemmataceae bacterium]